MFTGIITAIGEIASIEEREGDKRFLVAVGDLDIADSKIGDSIAINGVCITIVDINGNHIATDVSRETLSCTSFGRLKPGSRVNLEKAMQLSDRIHGHLVTGHVDAVGHVISLQKDARSVRFHIGLEKDLLKYISRKGAVSIDGVSLTVNDKDDEGFMINIIPHTLEQTIFSDYSPGNSVNIEVDLIARYLESLLARD